MRDRTLEAGFADVAAAILPDEELELLDAVRAVVREDRTLRAEVVGRAAPQTETLRITGTASTGTNVGTSARLPADVVISRIDADAKTAPSGGEFTAELTADGGAIDGASVTIQPGQTTGGSNVNTAVAGGVWLRLDCTAANSAANISITVTYRVTG